LITATVAGRTHVLGIDISNHQRAVDHKAVADAGYAFVIAKATEGTGYRDPWYPANRDGSLAAGLTFGAYHWLKPGPSARAQADAFLAYTERGEGCRLVVLDAEEAGITDAQVVDWCRIVRDACPGTEVVIYCGAYTDPRQRSSGWLDFVPWLAAYPTTAEHPDPAGLRLPVAPGPWGRWTLWQYTSNGRVPGVAGRCDVNVADSGWFSAISAEVLGTHQTPTQEDDDMLPQDREQLYAIAGVVEDLAAHVKGQTVDGTSRMDRIERGVLADLPKVLAASTQAVKGHLEHVVLNIAVPRLEADDDDGPGPIDVEALATALVPHLVDGQADELADAILRRQAEITAAGLAAAGGQ
jgi:GH25 family lysozyme M1 (1,4-beta-N-acetylmuramidase)